MAKAPARWLAVMAKEPRLGKVKSRLARDIGWVGATAFHRRTLSHLIGRLRFERRWNTVLAVTPDAALWNNCWPGGVALWAQGPGDLGARMGRLMRDLPPGHAVIVGSDIPAVKRAHIARAFRLLGDHDAVFGPAEDGGYWLVGLRRSPRLVDPFTGVRWSSPHALADTRANLAGLRIGMVETLADVDDGAEHGRQAAAAARRFR